MIFKYLTGSGIFHCQTLAIVAFVTTVCEAHVAIHRLFTKDFEVLVVISMIVEDYHVVGNVKTEGALDHVD